MTDLGAALDGVDRRPGPAAAPAVSWTGTAGAAQRTDRAEAAGAVASASDRAARIGAVTIALAWHLAIDLPALSGTGISPTASAVVAAGWLVTTAVGVAAGVRLLRGGLPPARRLAAVLLVVDVAVFAAVGGGQLFAAANWAWGGLGWFFLLVLWRRPVRWLLALLGAHATIALAVVIVDGVTAPADLARYAMYVYGVSSLPAAVFIGGTALSTLARDRAATAAATMAVEAERVAAEQARGERRARLGLVSGTAEEVLAELAAGDADPADPEVRRRCVLAAARLRRLIAESDDVPDPLLHELRAAADLAERDGLPIELVAVGVPPELPVEVRRRLTDPLTAALADARGWARVTVVAGPDEVVVSLVTPDHDGPDTSGPPGTTSPPGTDGDGGEPVEIGHERDGEIRWTQTQWRRT
ncbi:hypothetical protein [Micromonospora sp. NPDC093277]|uniref:hypothetical protein n=1 Tax=Micromonospora sp. NPDC093277 TaxID=3364291 RepID=UPI0037FF6009